MVFVVFCSYLWPVAIMKQAGILWQLLTSSHIARLHYSDSSIHPFPQGLRLLVACHAWKELPEPLDILHAVIYISIRSRKYGFSSDKYQIKLPRPRLV